MSVTGQGDGPPRIGGLFKMIETWELPYLFLPFEGPEFRRGRHHRKGLSDSTCPRSLRSKARSKDSISSGPKFWWALTPLVYRMLKPSSITAGTDQGGTKPGVDSQREGVDRKKLPDTNSLPAFTLRRFFPQALESAPPSKLGRAHRFFALLGRRREIPRSSSLSFAEVLSVGTSGSLVPCEIECLSSLVSPPFPVVHGRHFLHQE